MVAPRANDVVVAPMIAIVVAPVGIGGRGRRANQGAGQHEAGQGEFETIFHSVFSIASPPAGDCDEHEAAGLN
jgi:hypothetical protein